MKTLQRFLATMLLVFAFGIPTFAGDMSTPVGGPTPPPPPPPDQVTMIIGTPTDTAPGDTDIPALALLTDLLFGLLTMY